MKMQIKTTMGYSLTPVRMATIQFFFKKSQNITSVEEDMEQLELLCTIGVNVKWCNCYGKQYVGSSKKLKIE